LKIPDFIYSKLAAIVVVAVVVLVMYTVDWILLTGAIVTGVRSVVVGIVSVIGIVAVDSIEVTDMGWWL